MILFPALLTAALLAGLAAVHVYWSSGGKAGLQAALPEVRGRPAFTPGPALTLLVAAGLAGASLVTVLFALNGGPPLLRAGVIGLGAAFALRALGDFRVMGLSKRVRGTRFAALDDRLYTPLCLLLAASLLWLGLAGSC